MTIGEILAQILGSANAGAEHRYATAARGGDYLQKEEELANKERTQGIANADAITAARRKQAIIQAAAMAARQGPSSAITSDVGTPDQVTTSAPSLEVPTGASDDLAAAIDEQNTKGAKDQADLEYRQGAAREQRARAGKEEDYLTNAREQRASAEKIGAARVEALVTAAKAHGASAEEVARIRASGARPPRKPLIDVSDPENPGHTMKAEWDAETRTLVPVEGSSKASGLTARLEKGAGSVEQLGGDLLKDLQPGGELYDYVGPVMSRVENQGKALIGIRDPIVSELVGRLKSFVSAHLNLYPRGGGEMLKSLDALLESPQTPESLVGGIKGLMRLSQSLQAPAPKTPAPRPGGKVIKVDAEGNVIG